MSRKNRLKASFIAVGNLNNSGSNNVKEPLPELFGICDGAMQSWDRFGPGPSLGRGSIALGRYPWRFIPADEGTINKKFRRGHTMGKFFGGGLMLAISLLLPASGQSEEAQLAKQARARGDRVRVKSSNQGKTVGRTLNR